MCDEVYRVLLKMRWQPSIQIVPHYESQPLYIKALANSISEKIKTLSYTPDRDNNILSWYSRKIFFERETLTIAIVIKLLDY